MSVYVTQPNGDVWAYPDGSCWHRCLKCGKREFGYVIHPGCPQPGCDGSLFKDWRPDDPDGPVVEGMEEAS